MKKYLHLAGHLLLGAAAVAVFGLAVQLLWNALIPKIFGVLPIHFWQALGLLVLCRILFGTGGGRCWSFWGDKRVHKHLFHKKWHALTPEERKEMIRNHCFRHGFGHGYFHEEESGRKE